MELLDKLPKDLHWHVIKHMQHPLATIVENMGCRKCHKTRELRDCDMCKNLFCVRCAQYDKWCGMDGDMLVCIDCLVDKHTDCMGLIMQHGDCWHRGAYHRVSEFINHVYAYTWGELDRHPTYFDTLDDIYNKKIIRREFDKKLEWERKSGERYEHYCDTYKCQFTIDELNKIFDSEN